MESIAPIHISDLATIRERYHDKQQPASVVAGSFTLQDGRGGLTAFFFCLFFGFVYIIQKSSAHNWRCSKIVDVDLVLFT